MRLLLITAVLLAATGCGNSAPTVNTAPLTADQKKAIKEADDATDEGERGVDAGLKAKKKK